jgi:SAM-dependent methyltransferase
MESLKIFETFKRDKKFVAALAVLSAASWLVVSLAWPVFAGRDLGSFTMYFYWLLEPETPFRMLMSYRTILSSSLLGLLVLGGRLAAEIFLFIAYVLCNLSFYYLGNFFGRKLARFFSVLMLLDLSWTIFFHELSSDVLLAIFLVFWAVFFIRISNFWTIARAAALGLATFSLVLIRPIAQILVLVCLTPIILKGFNRKTVILAAVFLVAFFAGSLSYSSYNYARYGSFAVSRGSNFILPGYKAFIQDKILSPENGPASRELAQAVKKNLLDKPPYRSKNIGVNDFFSSGNPNMFFDLVNLSDRTWGWKDNYQVIKKATREAVIRHPLKFIGGSLKNVFAVFIENYVPPVISAEKFLSPASGENSAAASFDASYVWWPASGSSKTETEIISRGWASRMFEKRGNSFYAVPGNKNAAMALSRLAALFPFILFFAFFAFFLPGKAADQKNRVMLILFFPALLCAVVPLAAINSYPQFRQPFDFIFIMAGIAGFFSSVKIKNFLKTRLPWELSGENSGAEAELPEEIKDSQKYSLSGKKTLENLDQAKNFTAWLYTELRPHFKSGDILEIGSGTGAYSKKIIGDFSESNIILSDVDRELLAGIEEKLGGNPKVSFLNLDIARKDGFNLLSAKIDTAIAVNVLEHIDDDFEALKNIYGSLAPGGRFIALVPAHKFLYNSIDRAIGHYRRYSRRELADKAAAAGFKINKIFYFNFFSLAGWLLNGNILRKKDLNGRLLKIFDFMVPVFRLIEKNILRGKMGISLIIILEKKI